MLEHAAEMQRVEIGRTSAQDGIVDLPRLAQPPLAMQGQSLLDKERRRSLRCSCMLVRAQYPSPPRGGIAVAIWRRDFA